MCYGSKNHLTNQHNQLLTITCEHLIECGLRQSCQTYFSSGSVRYVQADIGGDTREDGLFVQEILIAEL